MTIEPDIDTIPWETGDDVGFGVARKDTRNPLGDSALLAEQLVRDENGGATYPAAGGYWELDASGSGCAVGAVWCVHMTPITTLPHDPGDGSEIDYLDFDGRPVARSFIEAKSDDAGL